MVCVGRLAEERVAVASRGLSTGLIAPIFSVVSQERVPAALRGRVFGTGQALATLATPLGTLLAGYLVGLVELRGTLLGMGIFTLAISIWAVTSRALRELDATTPA